MTTYAYPVDLTGHDGEVVVQFPDIDFALTSGADHDEALTNAADCLEEAISEMITSNGDIPKPSPAKGRPVVVPGALIAAKAALYEAMREARLSKVKMAAQLGVRETEVRRILDPSHATKIGRIEEALLLLGKRITIAVDAA